MKIIQNATWLIPSIALLTLAACSNPSAEDTTKPEAVATWTASGEASNGYQKTGAGVSLSFAEFGSISVGDAVTIPVKLKVESVIDTLSLSITTQDSLVLLTSASESFDQPALGSEIEMELAVQGLADGRYFINLLATTSRDQSQSGRSFSIPVSVGTGISQQKSGNDIQVDAEGNRYSVSEIQLGTDSE